MTPIPVTPAVAPITLGDTIPLGRLRTVALVVGGALLTAAVAQFRLSLGFTPVPITGQTFAVLLVGAALGWRKAVASQSLYWVLGAIGLPFYAGHEGGWQAATGSTFGYFVGFVIAAAAVGYLAERRQDRQFVTSWTAMLAGTVLIYAAGCAWLAHSLHIPFYSGDGKDAFTFGLTPFIAGDMLKLTLAAALTPVAWRFVERGARD